MLKRFVALSVFVFALSACDEGYTESGEAIASQTAVSQACVLYVDDAAEAEGDGSSWSHALNSVEAAEQQVATRLEGNDQCEIRTKGSLTATEAFRQMLDSYNGRVTLTHVQDSDETFIADVEDPSGLTPATESSEVDYEMRAACACDTFSGRVEMTASTDANGSSGSGVLEITNSLRIDGNEMITNSNSTLYLQNDNNGDLRVDGSTLMVDASANRVGIGTTSPTEALHVNGNIRLSEGKITNWSGPYASGMDLESYVVGIEAKDFNIKDQSGAFFAGFDTNSEDFVVHGAITADEIIVSADLADYVFQDGYDMKSLDEVESYIKENNSLPNMPTEADVDHAGLSLGDFNNLLLQKVEELTLHLIEQNKKIEALEKQVATIK